MSNLNLLLTEISAPSLLGIQPRPRLFNMIDDLCASPILWVGGPAGSGKTALVASYLSVRQFASTWCRARAGCGTGVLAAPLAFQRVPRPGFLIVEDSHQIPAAELSALTTECTSGAQQGVRVILIGRGEPPGTLASLIVQGAVATLAAPPHAGPHWPWPFKVYVLGRFRLLKADAPIRFSGRAKRKPLELLQALIALGATEVPARALIDALWPDSEGDAGYHALESALYRLRQLLGAPDAVRMAGSKLTLDRGQFWVDMWELENELRSASRDGVDMPEHVGRIRQLYEGHFLEHESEKPWALRTRQGLRDRFMRCMQDAARVYEERNLWQEAAGVYQSVLELESLSEDLYRGLMVCHRELGDHSEALQAYRRCRELLMRFFGVAPNAKTQAVYLSVRERASCAQYSPS